MFASLPCFQRALSLYEWSQRFMNGHYCAFAFQIYYMVFVYKPRDHTLYEKCESILFLFLYNVFFWIGFHHSIHLE